MRDPETWNLRPRKRKEEQSCVVRCCAAARFFIKLARGRYKVWRTRRPFLTSLNSPVCLARCRRLCAQVARRCPAFRLDVSIRATSTTPPPPPPPPTLPSTAYSAFLKLVDLSSGPSPVDFIRSARSRARARASIAFPWHTVMKIYGGALRGYALRRIIETAYCRARKLLEVFKHAVSGSRCANGRRGERGDKVHQTFCKV